MDIVLRELNLVIFLTRYFLQIRFPAVLTYSGSFKGPNWNTHFPRFMLYVQPSIHAYSTGYMYFDFVLTEEKQRYLSIFGFQPEICTSRIQVQVYFNFCNYGLSHWWSQTCRPFSYHNVPRSCEDTFPNHSRKILAKVAMRHFYSIHTFK
jgi:hypothetical protein